MNNEIGGQPEAVVQLTPQDWIDIQQLVAAFQFHEDGGDAAAWAALFTMNGVFVPPGKDPVEGQEKLLEHARRRAAAWSKDPKHHWSGNVVIRATRDGAEARSYQLATGKKADGVYIRGMSVITDQLRRENGKWRFHHRRIVPCSYSAA